MKKLTLFIVLLSGFMFLSSFESNETNKELRTESLSASPVDCTMKGKKLFGKVQFVTSHPDLKIQYVDSYADINVQMVTSGATSCGKWQEVTSGATLKVQIVNSFPDLKVKLVKSSPGMN